jgi:hypothetical protein
MNETKRPLADLTDSFTRVDATFRPQRTDDLRPEMVPLIGQRLTWVTLWVAEPWERFAGQVVLRTEPWSLSPYWVPEEDLEIHGILDGRLEFAGAGQETIQAGPEEGDGE